MQLSGIASRREPAFNIPTPILCWVALLVAVHAGRTLLSPEADMRLLLDTAFVPAPWSIALGWTTPEQLVAFFRPGSETQAGALRLFLAQMFAHEAPRPWSPVTYSFLHASWTHLGVNSLLFVVFGSPVLRRIGPLAAFALWLAAAMGGALAQWLYEPRAVDLVIGASASASGFLAAAATFVFAEPSESRWAFLRSQRAIVLLGLWFGSNLLNGLVLVPLGWGDADIAWPAHLGGLLVGMILCPLLGPRLILRS